MFDLRNKVSRAVALALVAVTTVSALTFMPAAPAQAATPSDGLCSATVDVGYLVSIHNSGDYCYLAFKNAGQTYNWTPQPGVSKADVLVVAGGGGGGSRHAGGGGAGGLVQLSSTSISTSSVSIVVGLGGSGGPAGTTTSGPGTNGGNSSFASSTAIGGGAGTQNGNGNSGGSGGGGGNNATGASSFTSGQGNSGGKGNYSSPWSGGGGGGAGAAGTNSSASVTGAGGNGLAISWITPSVATALGVGQISSSSVYFAGGGSGGGTSGSGMTVGAAGLGGGGAGQYNTASDATSGTANTGGGGGGSGQNGGWGAGGAGGSGVVVVRYLAPKQLLSFNASDINSYDSSVGTAVNDLSSGGTYDGVLTAGSNSSTATYNSATGSWVFPGGASASGPYINIGSTISSNAFAEMGMTFDFEANFGSQADFWERVIEVGDNNGNSVIIERNNQTTTLSLEVWNNGGHMGNCDLANAIPTTGNTMSRWTIAIDGATCRMWKDGSASTSLNIAYTAKPATGKTWDRNYVAKSNWSGGNSFEGSVKSVRIYAGALTPAQIGSFTYKTVTYSANGSTASNSTAVTSGALRVPAAITRAGYTFGGWNTHADGNGTNYLVGASYTPSADVTLYAKWTANTYTVTYNYNGANNNNLTVSGTYTSGGTAINLPNPTKTGYKFLGWYSDSGLNTFVANGATTYSPSGSTTAITLYAKWELVNLVISYNYSDVNSYDSSAGATINDLSSGGTYDATFTNHSSTYFVESTGSYTSAGGAAASMQYITLPSIASNGFNTSGITFDFEADFGSTKENYERVVEFGVSGASSSNVFISRNTTTNDLMIAVYDGATLSGTCIAVGAISTTSSMSRFTISLDGTTCKIWKDGTLVHSAASTLRPKANVTWAKNYIGASSWTLEQFKGSLRSMRVLQGGYTPDEIGAFTYKTVSYDSNAGSSNIVSTRYTSGSVKLPAGPTRSGYTFAGWFNETGATTSAGAAGSIYAPTADKTLYAGWTANNITVSFDSNGGSAIASQTVVPTGAPGANAATKPTDPTKAGFIFGGWSTSETANIGDVVNAATFPRTYAIGAANETLYAIWLTACAPTRTTFVGTGKADATAATYGETGKTYVQYRFNSVGACAWKVPGEVSSVDAVLVGGGGGGSYGNRAGGGGAGALMVTGTSGHAVTAGTYLPIQIGAGGAFNTSNNQGANGSSSVFDSVIAYGGGGGAGGSTIRASGSGGSSGGAATSCTAITNPLGSVGLASVSGWSGFANLGGSVSGITCDTTGGTGGGGAGGAGISSGAGGASLTRFGIELAGGGAGWAGGATRAGGGTVGGDWMNNFTAGTTVNDAVANSGSGGGSFGAGASGTLILQFVAPIYTTTFNYNGADGGTRPATIDSTDGAAAITLPTPTKTGNTFNGWYSDSGFTTFVGNGGTSFTATDDSTLYAKWTQIANQTVTFNNNGGSGTMTAQVTNVSTALTTNTFTRSGYTFSGWNTIAGGGGTAYSDGATYAFSASTTLYAQWTAIPNKTVSFNANGGSGTMSNQVTNFATNLTANTFSRNGYSFAGWNTAADGSGTSYIDGASYAFSSNATLYAQWSALPNKTVTYNNNSGSGTMTAQTTNVAANLTANSFTRTGYAFAGWNTAANGSGTAYANLASYAFTTDTTLYAQWTAVNKTVNFDANNGSGTMAAQVTNLAANLTANTFTRSGYTFAGWNTAANGTGTSYADASSYAFTADTTLYAQWTAVNYGITYNAPSVTSGAVPTDSANYNIGRSVAILGNSGNLVRTGYTFAGWTVASDGTGTVLVSGSTLTFADANINVYAKWTANTYTISYNVNGATGAQANTSDSYTTAGTAVTLSDVGTMLKAGHTFNGWATTASGTPIAGTYTTTSDVTLYAQWTINTITVTYDKGTASSANFTFPAGPDSANFGTRVNLSNNVASSVVLNGTYYAFVGWSDGTTTYATGTSYLLQSNVTMTAIWVQAYEVRYSFNGGTAANGSSEVDAECTVVNGSSLLCTNGQSITLNTAPQRNGYTFAGWRDQSGADIAAGTSHTLTLTSYLFYAQWTAVPYTVTYSPAGGASTPTEASKNIGDRFTLANSISRTGYTFAGWSDGSTIFGAGATYVVATSNIILTAQWNPHVYTVNYDWNGGSGTAVADASYTVGTTGLTLPSVTDQVKDGYTFSGWATSIGGLALATPFVPTASTTLYAIWGSGSYNITYAPELGTVGNTNLTVANGTAITLETPTRQGFVFDGWYTAQTGGTRVGGAGAQFTPAASRTLHARWTQASIYGIPVGNLSRLGSINASGSANSTYSGSNANSSVSVNVPSGALPNGTAVNIDMISDTTHASGLINGDKTFILSVAVSWLAGDGTVPDTASGKAISVTLNNAGIKAGALIYSIQGTSVVLLGTATQDGTVTFELTQDPGIYVVATSPTAPQNASSTTTSNSATISWQAPSSDGGDAITGYTVTLNTGATCTTTGALSCTINSLTAGTTYTYTVTATNSVGTSPTASGNFSIAANQTVTYNNNGGTGTMSNQVANASGSLTLNTFSRNGYSFGGWNTAANGSGTSYADGATFAFTAGTTLYAQWTASTYTVTYNYNGATTQNGPTSSGFTSGGSAITLPTPVKTGYSFDGWFTDSGLTTLLGAGGFSYSPTSSPTLYAGWTALPNQTVIFDANGGSGTMINQVTNVSTALTTNAFTQTGYTFAGWNTAANGSGTAYSDGATYAFTAGATLYAQWTLIPVAPPVVTPPTPLYERPDAPTNVTASVSGDSITVSWSAPTFNGGSAIVNYRVTSSSGMACITTDTSCTFNGVNKDVTYTFIVTSNNGYRVSNPSAASNSVLIPSQLINQRALSASGSQSARGAAVKIVVSGGSTNGPIIYDVSNGSATGCSIDGDGWLTATTSGTCLVTVTMLGDFTYKPVSASTTVSFLCKLIAQAPLTVNASGSTTVALSTAGGAGSGSVSYSVTDGTADCVLAGNSITTTKTGTCVVTATKAADDVYEAATSPSITVTVSVAKPVVVTPPPVVKVAPTEHVVAVAPSGKPVLVGTPLIKPIIFGPDSAKLDPGDLKQLRAAATLAKSKNMDVLITGFVKSSGATTLIEKLLASSRARAVATYLRKLGMKVSIAYAGYGAYNKVTPTSNDRRVEIRWIARD